MAHLLRTLTLACLSAFLGACQSPRSEPPPPGAPPPQRAWTGAFRREAVLLADEIVIEGPADLIDHVVLRQDEATAVYTAQTVTDGLLQELTARPEAGVEVRAQLDAWSLAAFRKITVLQRPGEVPVSVRASGNAFWAAADGSGERREQQLFFQGLHGR